MALSPEQRQQLLSRADGLRTEVSALEAERDAAVTDKSQEVQDAKLIAEVVNLEARRDVAEQQRDAVSVGTDQALQIMEAAIKAQEEQARQAESTPTVSPDFTPERDTAAQDPSIAAVEQGLISQDVDRRDEAESIEKVEGPSPSAPSTQSGSNNKGRGGNR